MYATSNDLGILGCKVQRKRLGIGGVKGVKDEKVAFFVADEGVAEGVIEEFVLVGQEATEGAGEVD